MTHKINKGAQAASTASPPQQCSVAPLMASSDAKPTMMPRLANDDASISSENNQWVINPSQCEARYLQWKESVGLLTHRASAIVVDWAD